MVVTREASTEHPEAPPGWKYWYTYRWSTNNVHTIRAGPHYLLYLEADGRVAAELRPGEQLDVSAQSVPTKLFVYRKLLVPATEEDLYDKNKLAQLTRNDPEGEQA